MKSPSVSIPGAVKDALIELRSLSQDDSLRQVVDSGAASIPFHQLLSMAASHLEEASLPEARENLDLTLSSLGLIQAGLHSVASSSLYRSSLAARAGFDQLLDALDTAADDLRQEGDPAKLRGVLACLERELGESHG